MAKKRVIYLLVFACTLVFVWAYQGWMAEVTYRMVILLPLFTILLSLPVAFSARVTLTAPERVSVGTECLPQTRCHAFLSMPPWKGRIVAQHAITGEKVLLRRGKTLPTDHCGGWICWMERARVCDYLGLISLPLMVGEDIRIIVEPKPLAVALPEWDRYLAQSWRPKAGGGFSETHELREYRPGDNVSQIHWKLSAKTGELILREPMEPQEGRRLLRLELRGTAEELDRKMGRLLWLGNGLVEKQMAFEIQALTGNGIEGYFVDGAEDLKKAVDQLLLTPMATEGTLQDRIEAAQWQYEIGGEPDEA